MLHSMSHTERKKVHGAQHAAQHGGQEMAHALHGARARRATSGDGGSPGAATLQAPDIEQLIASYKVRDCVGGGGRRGEYVGVHKSVRMSVRACLRLSTRLRHVAHECALAPLSRFAHDSSHGCLGLDNQCEQS